MVHIRTPEVVLGEGFQSVFGGSFDTLVFAFAGPFDVQAWVDRVEDEEPEGVKLRCASRLLAVRRRARLASPARSGCGPTASRSWGSGRCAPPTWPRALSRFQDLFAGAERKGLPLKGPGR